MVILDEKDSSFLKEDEIVSGTFNVMEAEYGQKEIMGSNGVFGPGYNSWITGAIPKARFKVFNGGHTHFVEIYGNVSGIDSGDMIKVYYSQGSFLGENSKKGKVSKIEKIDKENRVRSTFINLEGIID
jgi:hypothetical protein